MITYPVKMIVVAEDDCGLRVAELSSLCYYHNSGRQKEGVIDEGKYTSQVLSDYSNLCLR